MNGITVDWLSRVNRDSEARAIVRSYRRSESRSNIQICYWHPAVELKTVKIRSDFHSRSSHLKTSQRLYGYQSKIHHTIVSSRADTKTAIMRPANSDMTALRPMTG